MAERSGIDPPAGDGNAAGEGTRESTGDDIAGDGAVGDGTVFMDAPLVT